MAETAHDQDHPRTQSPNDFWRPILLGLVLLAGLGGGVWLMTSLSHAAFLNVEANAPATAVLQTEVVTIRSLDDAGGHTLRVGHQSIRPGRYRFHVNSDTTDLVFSLGEEFEVKAGQTLRIEVVGTPRDN